MNHIKYNTTKVLLAVGLASILFVSAGVPAFAQHGNAQASQITPQERKALVKKISDLNSQMQQLGKQAEAASKARDTGAVKKLASQYKAVEDRMQKDLQDMHFKVAGKTRQVPKPHGNPDPWFSISGGANDCDYAWEWASGSGSYRENSAYYGVSVNTSGHMANGFWPWCADGTVSSALINTYDLTADSEYAGINPIPMNGDYLQAYNVIMDDSYNPVPVMYNHQYIVRIHFSYTNGAALDAWGSFTG